MSAQPNPQYTRTMHNHVLKQAFSLTEDDLEANRAGQMTTPQQERLGQQRTDQAWTGCGGLALLVVFGFLIVTGVISGGKYPRSNPKDTGIMILCVAPIMGLFALATVGNMSDDVHKKRVLSFYGIVKLSIRTHRRSVYYRINSGKKSFEVPKHIYDAFVNGETYILYYTPSSETLIAAEYHTGPIPSLQEPPPQTSNPLTAPSQHEA